MALRLAIHPDDPQPRLIRQAADIVRGSGLIVYPTDSCYALGCCMAARGALDRLRAIRGIDERHHLTLMCRNLSDFGVYARIDNAQFRVLKAMTPGSYTFILAGTHELPRHVLHARRKSIGVRIPNHRVALALLEEVGEPLVSSTLSLPGAEAPLDDPEEILDVLGKQIDLVIDSGSCGTTPTTVIDLIGPPTVVRVGKGPVGALGE
jgi:tRNA threonylcarbamoyl adenosine modification protein (Sua5/YciO/YrdC/YwlC family)